MSQLRGVRQSPAQELAPQPLRYRREPLLVAVAVPRRAHVQAHFQEHDLLLSGRSPPAKLRFSVPPESDIPLRAREAAEQVVVVLSQGLGEDAEFSHSFRFLEKKNMNARQ